MLTRLVILKILLLLAGITVPGPAGAAEVTRPPACPLGDVSRAVAGPTPKSIVSRKKQAWEREHGGKEAARSHVAARLVARPSTRLIDKNSLSTDEREFAWRLARDAWRGLHAMTDSENGLPVDHVILDAASTTIAGDTSPSIVVGDYTNVTNIGLHLIAIVAAQQIGVIDKGQALAMTGKVLTTVEKLATHRGWLFNYYDTTSLERTSNFISFVDSAWLTAGLIVARSAFPEMHERCTKLITRTNYNYFYDKKTQQIAHGFFVNPSARSPYDYGMLYTEARLGSLLAIGKGDVPRQHWWAMARILPPGCAWQSLPPIATETRKVGNRQVTFGAYEWQGIRYLPSWGGSMFEALMPTLVLDEPQFAAASLGWNDHQHALVQRRYATEELRYPVWGLSPSARPQADAYSEYGVRVLGVRGYGGGAVTPHASALALAVTPAAALANLRKLAELYDAYGDFGFYDAVDPQSGAVAYRYLTLDQSMLFIALANYLGDHAVQKIFAADPIVQAALPLLAAEDELWRGAATAMVEQHGER